MFALEPGRTLTKIALGLIHTLCAVLTWSQGATRISNHLTVLAFGTGRTCTREATRNRIALATMQTRGTATSVTGDDLVTQVEALLLNILICHNPQFYCCARVSSLKVTKIIKYCINTLTGPLPKFGAS